MVKVVSIVTAVACVIALICGLWYFTQNTSEPQQIENETSAIQEPSAPVEVPREVPPGFKEYKSGRFGFSLLYPEHLEFKENMETATSYSIVFADKQGVGFQIYVVAYMGNSISDEQFKRDVPSGIRENVREATVGGVRAVAFESKDATVEDTQEIWFIKNGYLFEVTTYKPLAESLFQVMSTWIFLR